MSSKVIPKLFRKRDLILLCVVIIALYVTFDTSHYQFSFSPSWYRNERSITNKYYGYIDSHIAPIVSDIDSDGIKEVILITKDLKLEVLLADRSLDNPTDIYEPEILATRSLSETSIHQGKYPIALKVGYIEPYSSVYQRNQVIVVVTEDFTVSCFDHGLNLKWEKAVAHKSHDIEKFIEDYECHEVAVFISPIKIKNGTSGTVFVGLSMRQKSTEHRHHLMDDTAQSEMDIKSKLEHFTMYALDAVSGHVLWRHDGLEVKPEQYVRSLPQLAFQLDLQDLMTKTHHAAGINDWTLFRQSLISELPHKWYQRDDTFFHVTNFRRKHIGADSHKKATNSGNSIPNDVRDTVSQFGKKMHKRFTGIEKVPVAPIATFPHDASEHVKNPNVIVAHTQRGLEVVSLSTGAPITSLALSERRTYADIDGDGVVDSILVLENHHDVLSHGMKFAHAGVEFRQCTLMAVSGLPLKSQLFNGSLCSSSNSLKDPLKKYNENSLKTHASEIMSTSPVILRVIDEKTLIESKIRDIVVAINTGVVTCYSGTGEFKWQMKDGPTWKLGFDKASAVVFDADAQAVDEFGSHNSLGSHVVIVGDTSMSLVSHDGELLASIHLPKPPIAKPILGDFDSDGVTDIIIINEDSMLGYRLEIVESTKGLLISLIILAVIAFIVFVANIRTDIVISTNIASKSIQTKLGSNTKKRVLAIVRSTDDLHDD